MAKDWSLVKNARTKLMFSRSVITRGEYIVKNWKLFPDQVQNFSPKWKFASRRRRRASNFFGFLKENVTKNGGFHSKIQKLFPRAT